MDTLKDIKEKLDKEESIPKENKELCLRVVEFFYNKDFLIKFKYDETLDYFVNLGEIIFYPEDEDEKNILQLVHYIDKKKQGYFFKIDCSYKDLLKEFV